MATKAPNFFIVGAPKAGTTALSEYLRAHPSVFVSTPKEPFYFCSDFSGLPGPRTEREYLSLFSAADTRSVAIGEASAMYLYSDVALARIRDFARDARIIVGLRSPIEIAVSFHSQQLYGMSESEEDFENAWRLQEIRAQGRSLPRLVREPRFLQYASVAKLGAQVQRLLNIFPRTHVHFVVFDDLVTDPAAVYRQLLGFLAIPDDARNEFAVENARKRNRSRLLARALHRPPRALTKLAAGAKRLIGRPDIGFLDGLRRRNTAPLDRPRLRPDFRAELAEVFRDDVMLLSELVGRDLLHWVDRLPVTEAQ